MTFPGQENTTFVFKKQLFDLEVKDQGPKKVIMVCDTPPYGHAPTYEISLTYLERQKSYGPDKKILFKKELFDLEVKGQCPTKVITVRACPDHNFFVFQDRSMIFRMWVHDHKVVCRVP
jgi:hypothetical protein